MKLGMVGLPNVGKSTLFNAITNAGALSANYPFATIEPNTGVVSVPDTRLDYLREIYSPDKFTPASLEFVDIAGLVKGASKGEGLGNKFLADIREADALVHVVRCFADDNIIHVEGSVNAARDIETINLELIFSDLELLGRRLDKAKKAAKGDRNAIAEAAFLEKLIKFMEDGNTARSYDCSDPEAELLAAIPLLSGKPVIYAANLSEADYKAGIEKNSDYISVCETAKREHAEILPICAELEAEVAAFDDESEREMFLADLGLTESGLSRIIREGYALLGLISYLTAGKPEVRAWTIKKGTKAPGAAGKIHTDFEKGFIRAEIVSFDDFRACSGSMTAAKEKGLVRLEGKDYVMNDGDIVLFRFNV
ncbi:ribosome-binding ATPase YchF [Clostridia bacterium]|nr:ribosome-binding ATPase YchF [Clostridia bacterium]